jgi:hypothetical protein
MYLLSNLSSFPNAVTSKPYIIVTPRQDFLWSCEFMKIYLIKAISLPSYEPCVAHVSKTKESDIWVHLLTWQSRALLPLLALAGSPEAGALCCY